MTENGDHCLDNTKEHLDQMLDNDSELSEDSPSSWPNKVSSTPESPFSLEKDLALSSDSTSDSNGHEDSIGFLTLRSIKTLPVSTPRIIMPPPKPPDTPTMGPSTVMKFKLDDILIDDVKKSSLTPNKAYEVTCPIIQENETSTKLKVLVLKRAFLSIFDFTGV